MLKKSGKFILALVILLVPFVALAQWSTGNLTGFGLPDNSVASILKTFIRWAVAIIGLLGIIAFIYAGFLYLTAGGDTTKLDTAKKVMLYAIAGIAVAVLGLVAVMTIDRILSGGSSGSSSGGTYIEGSTNTGGSGLIQINN